MITQVRSAFGRGITYLLLNPARLLVFTASLVPIILVIMLVVAEGLNAPFYDQWHTTVPIAFDTLDGKLTIARLTVFHGPHREFFTNILTAISARFFGFNLYLELFFTIVLGIALLVMVVALIRKDFPHILRFVLIPTSLLIFSLRGQHTWLMSFLSAFLWVTLFFLLALWTLRHRPVGWRSLLLASLFSLCSTFSNGNGLIVWFLLLVGLPLFGYRKLAHFIFWIAATVVGLFLFYSNSDPTIMFSSSGSNVFKVLEYMLVYLGGIFVPAVPPAGIVGTKLAGIIALVSVGLFLANLGFLWRWTRAVKPLVTWLLIAGYAAGTGFITGIGRASSDVDGPFNVLSERYVIIVVFWWISLLVLGSAVLFQVVRLHSIRLRDYWVSAANIICFVALVPLALYATCYQIITYHHIYPESERCFAQYVITHDRENMCLSYAFIYHPDEWLPRIDELAQRRLAMFSAPSLEVELTDVKFTVFQSGASEPAYGIYVGADDGVSHPALSEHAPAQLEYTLDLPLFYPQAQFVASVYLDPTNLLKDPDIFQDGVVFSAAVIGENGEVSHSGEVRFDPHTSSDPIPFQFDLTAYVGQTVRLQLQTGSLETDAYDWAFWVDPVIRLSD